MFTLGLNAKKLTNACLHRNERWHQHGRAEQGMASGWTRTRFLLPRSPIRLMPRTKLIAPNPIIVTPKKTGARSWAMPWGILLSGERDLTRFGSSAFPCQITVEIGTSLGDHAAIARARERVDARRARGRGSNDHDGYRVRRSLQQHTGWCSVPVCEQ